jgi:hypothetical protein
MAEELKPDPTLQPPADVIHMPEPSYLPFALAIGITIALLGILSGLMVLLIGVAIVVVVLVRWIGGARREMADLPLEHGH